MNLLDLPEFTWAKGRKDVKVLRHRDLKRDLWEIRRLGSFDNYQNTQSWDVFGNARYILSFFGEGSKYAKFVGVWEVNTKSNNPSGGFRYVTTELSDYSDLEGRLVIEWGKGAHSWAQWLHRAGNKPIFEILPPNFVRHFPGFYDFVLSYSELHKMIVNPESNREWYRMLSSVSAVYLIQDSKTGRQYVGSAYGDHGLWGRWKTYAHNPHGNNQLLINLLSKIPKAFERFQFSVLRVFESGTTKEEVIGHEQLIKRKLGSRAFGLNNN